MMVNNLLPSRLCAGTCNFRVPAPQVVGSSASVYGTCAAQEHSSSGFLRFMSSVPARQSMALVHRRNISPALAFIKLIMRNGGHEAQPLSSALYATSLPKACAPTETLMHPIAKRSFLSQRRLGSKLLTIMSKFIFSCLFYPSGASM